jgi:hypothetical protein
MFDDASIRGQAISFEGIQETIRLSRYIDEYLSEVVQLARTDLKFSDALCNPSEARDARMFLLR